MMTPLVVAIVLLMLHSPVKAASPTIPAEYRGEWCQIEDLPYFTPQATIDTWRDSEKGRCGSSSDGNRVKIGAYRYASFEFSCRPVQVMINNNRAYISKHTIKFRCLYPVVKSGTEEHSFAITVGANGAEKHLWIDDVDWIIHGGGEGFAPNLTKKAAIW